MLSKGMDTAQYPRNAHKRIKTIQQLHSRKYFDALEFGWTMHRVGKFSLVMRSSLTTHTSEAVRKIQEGLSKCLNI